MTHLTPIVSPKIFQNAQIGRCEGTRKMTTSGIYTWGAAHAHTGQTLKRVNVITLTYNHAKYIVECIDSIIAQKGGFQIDVHIYDDASTDGTREVIRSYLDGNLKLPEGMRVHLFSRSVNIGVVKSVAIALQDCVGYDYFTFCEGDDLWSSNERISKHLQFLDAHPSCSFSFNSLMLSDSSGANRRPHPDQEQLQSMEMPGVSLAACNYIGNFSCCFYRGELAGYIPNGFFDMYSVDWAFNLLCARRGMIGHIKEHLSIYRQHSQGEWSGRNELERSRTLLVLIDAYDVFFQGIYHEGLDAFKRGMVGSIKHRLGIDLLNPDDVKNSRTISSIEPSVQPMEVDISTAGIVLGQEQAFVSVIIPSYNQDAFIAKAIESVLVQDYANFELIISDDASSDNSWSVIQRYLGDKRIRAYLQKPNLGAVENLEFLIENARGSLIAILNSDDFWLEGKLTAQVNLMNRCPEIGACFTWADLVDESGGVIQGSEKSIRDIFMQPNRTRAEWVRYLFDKGNCLCHPSVLIRKTVYDQLGLYNPFLRQLPDYEMWMRVVCKFDIHVIQKSYVRHVRTGCNTSCISSVNKVRSINEFEYIYDRFFAGIPDALFIEAFADVLRVPTDLRDSVHVTCEKLFLLLDSGACRQAARTVALRRFMECANDPVAVAVLRQTFLFSSSNFHRYAGIGGLGDAVNGADAKSLRRSKSYGQKVLSRLKALIP